MTVPTAKRFQQLMWWNYKELRLHCECSLNLSKKIVYCPRSGLLKSVFCHGSPGAKNTSIPASVRVGGKAAKTCAQLGCFGGKVTLVTFSTVSGSGHRDIQRPGYYCDVSGGVFSTGFSVQSPAERFFAGNRKAGGLE